MPTCCSVVAILLYAAASSEGKFCMLRDPGIARTATVVLTDELNELARALCFGVAVFAGQ
jgi:hypothetical protein